MPPSALQSEGGTLNGTCTDRRTTEEGGGRRQYREGVATVAVLARRPTCRIRPSGMTFPTVWESHSQRPGLAFPAAGNRIPDGCRPFRLPPGSDKKYRPEGRHSRQEAFFLPPASEVERQLRVAQQVVAFPVIRGDAVLPDRLPVLLRGIAHILLPVVLWIFFCQ